VPSLRNRSAEALRYLLGRRVDVQRQRSRELVIAMAGHCGEPEPELLAWFVDAGRQAFEVRYLAVWLCDSEGHITDRAGAVERLSDTAVAELLTELRRASLVAGRLGGSPVAVEDRLMAAGAAAVVRMDHPAVDGLVLVGHGADEWHEERLNTLVLVVEQLAITVHTGRLQAERLAAERRALQQDKLAALGLVVSSVAHEVKNPLSSIRTLATLMAEEQPPDAPHAEDLRQMIGELDRLALSVQQLLQFSRPGGEDRVGVDLAEALNGIVRILRHLATRQGLTLNVPAPEPLPPVRMPAGVLREILFNLLGNAIEAARSRVELHFRRDGDDVVIELSDDGPGIPESLRAQMFRPFVSGRPDGTGLGLYLVGRHLHDWGGRIDCHSAPGKGTLFRLRLPLMSDAADRTDRR
jgi:signal transduction histidine kinase